jgi:hypothetical protein
MNDLALWWLIPVLLEVVGVSIALTVVGFAYEGTLRGAKPFLRVLLMSSRVVWLAISEVIFAVGVNFSQAGWLEKSLAIAMALGLIGLVWYSTRVGKIFQGKAYLGHLAPKTVGIWVMKIWFSTLVVLVMLWAIHLGWHVYHLYSLAINLQKEGIPSQAENIVRLVNNAAEDMNGIEEYLRPLFPVFNVLQNFPGIGPYLGQVDPLLTYANGLATAGDQVTSVLEPLMVAGENKANSLSLPERVSQVLQASQTNFENANIALEQAREARNRINSGLLPDSVKPYFTLLDNNIDSLEAGVQFLQEAPRLLGVDQTQNYLVLAQNRDEERATGGFISGIGLVVIHDGKIEQFTLGDSYAVDDFSKPYPAPPEALKRFMLADYWVTRDANWSPDFPTSARQAQELYTLSTGINTQGVFAFNQLAVKRILEVIGAVQIPGTDEPITSENVESYMRWAWAPEPDEGLSTEWWLHRKDFMQLMGNAILEKILAPTAPGQLLELSEVMIDLLKQSQMLLYFNDSTAQNALEQSGWDGALFPGKADYLYLVDSNVGFNKVDAVISRSLHYQVDLRDRAHPTGRVTLTYQHAGTGNAPCTQEASYGNGTYQNMLERCYWDYWRIYTPGGSGFISSSVPPVASDLLLNAEGWSGQVESLAGEANTHVFAGLLVLPIGKSSQITVSYQILPVILQAIGKDEIKYSLNVQVQPGLDGLPFQLEITPPENYSLVDGQENWTLSDAGILSWQGVLDHTTEFSIFFQAHP